MLLYDSMMASGLKVWLGCKCQTTDRESRVEAEICRAIIDSSCIMCIVSRAAVNDESHVSRNLERLNIDSPFDPLLFEWRLALEFKHRGLVNAVYPVMVGDVEDDGFYSNYIRDNCGPVCAADITVNSVEATFVESLEREGMSPPLRVCLTVKYYTKELCQIREALLKTIQAKVLRV